MEFSGYLRALVGRAALITGLVLASLATSTHARCDDELIGHKVVLDEHGKLLAWTGASEASPYDHVVKLSWAAFKSIPTQPNGLKTYFTSPRFEGTGDRPFRGIMWAHNPAGLAAMLGDSALSYYAYSGDFEVLNLAREFLDHILEYGLTPADAAWASVPYSSSTGGSTVFAGGDDTLFCEGHKPCGRGDGVGNLEPDKVGELGLVYLRFYELSQNKRYLDVALACADALTRNIRAGDAAHSPWPFRVDAQTGSKVREEYTSNVLGPVKLFDELLHIGVGQVDAYKMAREHAWKWLLRYPLQNGNWSQYFEDIPIHADPSENVNQYVPLETARYLLQHPGLDAKWRTHVRGILDWVAKHFTIDAGDAPGEKGHQYGAEVLSEQVPEDRAKMGSHTARYASVNALWSELTGDKSAREKAFRSFNWATYACNEAGIVKVGTSEVEGYWFSDGYGDYARHFLAGLASIPDWAPGDRAHVLRSSSLVSIIYYAEGKISYSTVEPESTEVIRLPAPPTLVEAGHVALKKRAELDGEGYTLRKATENGGYVLKLRHHGAKDVEVIY